jgi:nucleotidyltransferase/DNA polymerase involved in DNA repair
MQWTVYVDIDAFYVSCELRDRPDLVGRPVIVGPNPAESRSRGVVLSASYEARQFGVRSALPAAQAQRLCPDAVWIRPDFDKYQRVAEEVRELLRAEAGGIVALSIDEAAFRLETETKEEAEAFARRLQAALRGKLGLPSTFGVAPYRVVAKMATDVAKPAGVRVVAEAEVVDFLRPLSVRAIPGVGPKTEGVLADLNIRTIGEITSVQLPAMRRRLGAFADELLELARGRPHEPPLEEHETPRSRSLDRTFEEDVGELARLEEALGGMATELAEAVRAEGFRYQSIGVRFRWEDFEQTQRSLTLPVAKDDSSTLVGVAVRLGRELWHAERESRGRRVRRISVQAARLQRRTGRQARLDTFPLERAAQR